MTLDFTRTHTSALLQTAGEVKIPPIEVYTTILHQQLQLIASNSYVLSLETQAEDFRVLREIAEGIYIRMPVHPQSGNSEIDIDEELVYAASNMAASVISRQPINKAFFEETALEIIQAYDFKIYETLKLREDKECP